MGNGNDKDMATPRNTENIVLDGVRLRRNDLALWKRQVTLSTY